MDKRCVFCSNVIEDSEVLHCGSLKCNLYSKELLWSIEQEVKQQRYKAAKALLYPRERNSSLDITGLKRFWYTVKGLICIAFDLEGRPERCWPGDEKELAYWDIGPALSEHGGEDWMAVSVGAGITSNWNYHIYPDQTY